MRHKKSFNHLGRTKAHREAMLANMAVSLIKHKRINTTLAKAKALRSFIEPLITRSKNDSTHSRRIVFSRLQDKEAVTELFREISQKVADRPGGYTRILKTGTRLGDNAEMCMIELVDYNELLLKEKKQEKEKEPAAKKSSSRGRRGKGKSKTEAAETGEKKETTTKSKKTVKKEAEKMEAPPETEMQETREETPETPPAEEKTENSEEK